METAIEQFVKDFYLYAEPYAYSIEEDKWVISEEDFEYLISKVKEKEKQIIKDAAKWMPKPFDGMEFLDELTTQYYNETFNSK